MSSYIRIKLPYRADKQILALGAQSKSSFCFAKGNTAYLSESGGDLSDPENFKKFEKQIKLLQKKLKIKSGIIACDLHPEYIATKYAYDLVKGEGWKVKKVQHHEAHVASCMADNGIRGNAIGVAFDGTGFGSDGNIWGGEFFIGDIGGFKNRQPKGWVPEVFKRVAHLKYIPMPGGEACIREPWRMAFSYLYAIYGDRDLRAERNLLFKMKNGQPKGWVPQVFKQIIDKKINSPLTSSAGRLFDGVSSLIGLCEVARYEGEAAIRLEKEILVTSHKSQVTSQYKFKYIDENGIIIIDWKPVIKDIVKDLKNSVKRPEISLKFHNAICNMIKDVCILLRKKYKINKVCLSGGVFQNRYLKTNTGRILTKQGFKCYFHNKTPTHDGGIALGQAVLAGV